MKGIVISLILLCSADHHSGRKTEAEVLSHMKPALKAAMEGSGEAAMNISYALAREMGPVKSTIHPAEEWERIGAENGYANAQHAYAQTLWSRRKQGEIYSMRARYWAKRAAAQNFLPAKELLDMFDTEENQK
jgi:hypothetical protein